MNYRKIVLLLIVISIGVPFAGSKESFRVAKGILSQAKTNPFAERQKLQVEIEALQSWQAGSQVSPEAVSEYGIDRCFSAEEISDATFQRMRGRSFKSNCTVARHDLRYVRVLHRTIDGKTQLGELVCHKSIGADLVEIFKQLYAAHYPIESMMLIDNYDADDERSMAANNTSCFNFRSIGRSTKLSNHSQGKAIDINPLYNPCVRRLRNGTTSITPTNGKPYANRTANNPYKIDKTDFCYKLFIAHGFQWGGSWRSVKDYQHFEKT